MSNRPFTIHLILMTIFLLLVSSFSTLAAPVPRMASDELKPHIGTDDYLILDVRANRDWSGSTEKILGAERVDPGSVDQWAGNYAKERTIVLYCA